jgi:tRNA A-37 threonylcarbamoyl transferase component Bud32/sugar lactone lactonase YvrE
MAPTVGADPRIGTELAGYRIEVLIGRGGMSVVYLAEDLALGRKVALKLMAPELSEDRSFRERFRRESRLAASIDHPNVIPIYDAGEAEGLLYIAMRYVEGTDLKALLARDAPLPPERTLALLSQVAAALDAAHERGLVHRDVKPSNILLAGTNGDEHVYLADFGLTKTTAEGEESESMQLSGTADYVSPEQITGGTSEPSSDLYSLGCVLYQCLTGRVPFPRDKELAVLWAHVDEPPPRPTEALQGLPRAVDDVVARALSKEPAARYETASALIEAARLAFPKRRAGRRRLLLGAAIVVLVTVAVSVLAVMRASDESMTDPTLALTSGALQRVDPETNELVATIRIGGEPVDIAAGVSAVWLVDADRNTLVRVDPETNIATSHGSGTGTLAAVGTHPAYPSYVGSAADGPLGAVLARITADDVSTVETAAVGDLPGFGGPEPPAGRAHVSAVAAIAATDEAGWVVDASALLVSRIGRIPPVPRMSLRTEGMPTDLVTAGRRQVWVAERYESTSGPRGRLLRVHQRGDVTARLPLPFAPSAIAAGLGGLWVADGERGRVWRIDVDGRKPTSVSVGGRPIDVAVGAGSVWALTGGTGSLVRIDPKTLRIVARIEVGANPTALAFGAGDVWVAAGGGRPLSPASFPREFRRELYEIEGVYPERPGEQCDPARGPPVRDCLVVGFARVTGKDGTSGSIRVAMREKRRRGGVVSCLGTRYVGPFTSDVKGHAGTGRLELPRWGVVALHLERNVLITSNAPDAPALCLAQSGTWLGVRGPIRGVGGRFTTRGPGRVLVFDS